MKKIALLFGLFLSVGLVAQNEVSTYFENGNTKMELLKVGERSMQTTYFESGEIKQMGAFLNDRPIGVWRTFNTQGEVVSEGGYENGKKSGKWTVYTQNMKRKYELYYEDGIRLDAIALK